MKIDITIALPEGSEHFDSLERLGAFVAQVAGRRQACHQTYRDSKVMLGHVLNQIDQQIPYHQRGQVYAHFGLHPKTAQHAKKLASKIGDGFGRIDYELVKGLQISRAEAASNGVPLSREERTILEAAAETLTSTNLEHLAGIRSIGKPPTTHGPHDTIDDRHTPQGNRGQNEPSSFCLPTTPPPAGPSAPNATGPATGTAGGAGTSALSLTGNAGASGAQLSFDWEVTQDRAYTIADWIWQRADELNEQRRRRVDELLAQVIGVWVEAEHERSTRMSAKAHEIGDLMETGRSRYRTG